MLINEIIRLTKVTTTDEGTVAGTAPAFLYSLIIIATKQ